MFRRARNGANSIMKDRNAIRLWLKWSSLTGVLYRCLGCFWDR